MIFLHMVLEHGEVTVRPCSEASRTWLVDNSHEYSAAFDRFGAAHMGKPIRTDRDDDIRALRDGLHHQLRLSFPEVEFLIRASVMTPVTTWFEREVCP